MTKIFEFRKNNVIRTIKDNKKVDKTFESINAAKRFNREELNGRAKVVTTLPNTTFNN